MRYVGFDFKYTKKKRNVGILFTYLLVCAFLFFLTEMNDSRGCRWEPQLCACRSFGGAIRRTSGDEEFAAFVFLAVAYVLTPSAVYFVLFESIRRYFDYYHFLRRLSA